jgi:glutamate carboxypeptidase
MSDFRRYVGEHMEDLLACLQEFVAIESPSTDKAALDHAAGYLAHRFQQDLLARIAWFPQASHGDHLAAHVGEGPRQILLLGHHDTVWPIGTLAGMPCRVDGDRLTGPGIYDMKAGTIQALFALRAVQELGLGQDKTFVFLGNSDEETGSHTSRPIIDKLAQESEMVLVLEPAAGPVGAAKLWRKGVGAYQVDVQGVASHAGGAPEKGRSALLELAHQIIDLQAITDPGRGVTINVGVASGGTRSNVVPARAEAHADLRVPDMTAYAEAHRRITQRPSFVDGTKVTVSGGLNRPPMVETPASRRIYEKAAAAAMAEGFDLPVTGVGGGSDGNFTAALGVPTLDGLGAVGSGAHADHEHVLLSSIAPRVAFLARFLAEL